MSRLFIRLLVVIMFVFMFGVAAVLYCAELYAQARWQTFSQQLFDTLLVAKESEDDQSEQHLDTLQMGASVVSTQSLFLDQPSRSQLLSGELLIKDGYIFYHIAGDHVAVLPWEETDEQLIQRLIFPVFQLSYKNLGEPSPSQWLESFPPNQGQTSVQPTLVDVSSLEPSLSQVLARGSVAYAEEASEITFWWPFPQTHQAVQIGPLPAPLTNLDNWVARVMAVLLFMVIFAVCVACILRPLRKELSSLSQAVESFGAGDLSARAQLGRHRAIRDMAYAFNTMAEQTQSSIQAQKELTYGVSHDLRTPITRLTFMLEMAANADQPEALSKQLSGMRRGLSDLERMVVRLLDYAKMDSMAPQLDCRETLVIEWLQDLVQDYQLDCREGLSIKLVDDEVFAGLVMYFDRQYIERALTNIVGNAVRHACSVIQLKVMLKDEWLHIVVSDDGEGIPVEERERVLRPFARLDAHRGDRGHGLGLAIAHKIMAWHGGDIGIAESASGGAAISLIFPTRALKS